ncbi:hypothetical protein B0T21DRAFT_348122 [Apiosordaria backusii]|uniref:2EXR domain-containing protein n=1 Tax=Apiosordaria backusii TaxID=314023 RepID=A0AA40BKW7_9PEZI|nr:hypothetical protein B0T21DRAFT_348122 [Apiosordaria backusii]
MSLQNDLSTIYHNASVRWIPIVLTGITTVTMPPKKALGKRAASKAKPKAIKKKSTIGTNNKPKGTATSSTKKDDDAKDDAIVEFSQFRRFPTEIRQDIFTQALRKPSIHYMAVTRDVVPGYRNDEGNWVDSTWHLKYAPRSGDNSSHRLNEKITNVNDEAQQAVELAMKNPGKLPFRRAWSLIDVDNDLVVFDFAAGATQHERSNFRYFHVNNQFFAPFFDFTSSYPQGKSEKIKTDSGEEVVVTYKGLADVKRVGVIYKHSHNPERTCGKQNTVFQCCIHVEGTVRAHSDWIMCPDEVAGFIDSIPSIEEFYFVVKPEGKNKEDKERLELYKKWFFTTYHEQIRLFGHPGPKWLKMFHDADKTYIEVDRYLMLNTGDNRRIDLDIVREVRLLVEEVHSQLIQDGPHIPKDNRRIFRSSYKRRKEMVCKILLPVSI